MFLTQLLVRTRLDAWCIENGIFFKPIFRFPSCFPEKMGFIPDNFRNSHFFNV